MNLADLISLPKYSYNDKYWYILTVVDVFLRYAWSILLRNKAGASVNAALKSLFQHRKPLAFYNHIKVLNSLIQVFSRISSTTQSVFTQLTTLT
jgi:hypothetical protein